MEVLRIKYSLAKQIIRTYKLYLREHPLFLELSIRI